MLFVVFSMLVILALCGLLVAFVAFPHSGHQVPGLTRVGETVDRAAKALAERLPVLHETDADPVRTGVTADRR